MEQAVSMMTLGMSRPWVQGKEEISKTLGTVWAKPICLQGLLTAGPGHLLGRAEKLQHLCGRQLSWLSGDVKLQRIFMLGKRRENREQKVPVWRTAPGHQNRAQLSCWMGAQKLPRAWSYLGVSMLEAEGMRAAYERLEGWWVFCKPASVCAPLEGGGTMEQLGTRSGHWRLFWSFHWLPFPRDQPTAGLPSRAFLQLTGRIRKCQCCVQLNFSSCSPLFYFFWLDCLISRCFTSWQTGQPVCGP